MQFLRTLTILPLLSILIVAAPATAGPATFHVATTGSDTSGDGSVGNPWSTITHALDSIADGALVLVAPGTYSGRIRLRNHFASGVTVRSEVRYQARLRASSETVLTCYDCEGITLEGFDVAHSGPGASALVMQIQDENPGDATISGRVTLRDNIFHDSYNNDIVKVNNAAADVLITGNMFYNQAGSDEHLDINSVTGVTIQDNVFFNDFAGSGRSDSDTSSFIVIKDSNSAGDGIVGSSGIVVRRNVFLHWEGSSGQGFVRVGEDGTATFEATDVLIENNLMLGNNSAQIRSPLQFQGVSDVTARANTITGNLPAKEFGFRIVTVGANQACDGIHVHNNIWSDPTGTMGDVFNRGSATSNLTFDNNLFWNDGNAFPTSGESIVEVTDDVARIVGDPLLGDASAAVLPRWQSGPGQFADGSVTIREVFENLVALYGTPASGSAALDAADAGEMPADDILGNDRSIGGAPDVGALEQASCVGAVDGTVCDDGNGCTGPDLCSAGVCAAAPDDGAACDDGNPCTHDDSCATGACVSSATPRNDCSDGDVGLLRLRNKEKAGKDKLQWKWVGTGTVVGDFGDPATGTTDYTLCVYDTNAAEPSVAFAATIAAGANCDGRDCWKGLGGKGFRYKSRTGTPQGVRLLKIKATAKTSMKFKGGRDSLVLPPLPLLQSPEVVVQLAAGAGACWQTNLPTPAMRNSTGDFLDKR
ncbi:MAG: hypothetical protein ACI8TX_000258 [Hyphomicrobiaceae bacterium]|jgi:hypothetical protein